MGYYKDFSYLQYILNLPFDDGFNLYAKCLLNIKKDAEEKIEDRYFQMWLRDQENGSTKHTFKEYLDSAKKEAETRSLGMNFRNEEEKRIINEIKNKKPKLKRVI